MKFWQRDGDVGGPGMCLSHSLPGGEQRSLSVAEQLLLVGARGAGKWSQHSPASGNAWLSGALCLKESLMETFLWSKRPLCP